MDTTYGMSVGQMTLISNLKFKVQATNNALDI